jgi:hypothetical protein
MHKDTVKVVIIDEGLSAMPRSEAGRLIDGLRTFAAVLHVLPE